MTRGMVTTLNNVLNMTISAAYSGSSLYCWAMMVLFTAEGIAVVINIAWATTPFRLNYNNKIIVRAGPMISLMRLAATALIRIRLNDMPAICAPSMNSTVPIIASLM